METQDATGSQIGEMKIINGKLKICKVGAFTDKFGECFSQFRWYVPSGKQARKSGGLK